MSLFLLFSLPILTGILSPLVRRGNLRRNLVNSVFLIGLIASLYYFIAPPREVVFNLVGGYNLVLGLNRFSRVILIFVNLFGLLVGIYSKDYSALKESRSYFSYLAWLIGFANLVCLSADFISFIFAWGATLALLYAFLRMGSASSANKALSIVGLGDFSLILGICLYIYSSGNIMMPIGSGVLLSGPLNWSAFILMLTGAFAKAGCGPLHTWIPEASESTPLPIMAILPASLDKLLGIYLLGRICVDFFILNEAALALLLLTGSLTIIFAVMMALIQHDLRKLLAYHSISQVGYMVLGFGTGVPIGIAAAVFHMINNTIYKSGLFLTGATVGEKKNTFDLEKLGGLAACMPLTFAAALVFALSISGVPPFNGFASKWMLYQGTLIGLGIAASKALRMVYIFALVAAMFGSALTLASFIKFIHAVFLGQESVKGRNKITPVTVNMKIALLSLAALCILLGVLPFSFLRIFIAPWLTERIFFIGSWQSLFAFIWLAAGLLLGLFFYAGKKLVNTRQDKAFTGAEGPVDDTVFPATEFYKGIEEMPAIKKIYRAIKIEALDLYNIVNFSLRTAAWLLFIFVDRAINLLTVSVGHLVLGLSGAFRRMHTGALDLYLAWALAGLIAMFFILMGR
ncbi:MAG: proton-conducting transporter membrane subunit [Candidatus Omnitrophota bacterium]